MDQAIMSVRMKQWAGLLQEAAASGLPKGTWCEQNGISRRQFFHWQKKIREFVLKEHPELGLSVQEGQIRAVNNQMTSSLPIFCELKPEEDIHPVPSVPSSQMDFIPGAMIQCSNYQIFVGDSITEKTLSTILTVIQHA